MYSLSPRESALSTASGNAPTAASTAENYVATKS